MFPLKCIRTKVVGRIGDYKAQLLRVRKIYFIDIHTSRKKYYSTDIVLCGGRRRSLFVFVSLTMAINMIVIELPRHCWHYK